MRMAHGILTPLNTLDPTIIGHRKTLPEQDHTRTLAIDDHPRASS